jgi:hypothetical protein
MGKQEVEVTGATVEIWSLQSVRRAARLVSKARGRKKHESHIPAHQCSGPSFLHNLLPILEPFLFLNPKLQHIEDRILGRQQVPRSGRSHAVPLNIRQRHVTATSVLRGSISFESTARTARYDTNSTISIAQLASATIESYQDTRYPH